MIVTKLTAVLAITASIFVLSYFTMIHGWGLDPVDHRWIMAAYIWTALAPAITQAIIDD